MKPLEALERLLDLAIEESSVGDIGGLLNHSKEYENTRSIVEKSLKALELINNKNVDVWLLKNYDYKNYVRVRKSAGIENNIHCIDMIETIDNELTEREFNLLEEALDDD